MPSSLWIGTGLGALGALSLYWLLAYHSVGLAGRLSFRLLRLSVETQQPQLKRCAKWLYTFPWRRWGRSFMEPQLAIMKWRDRLTTTERTRQRRVFVAFLKTQPLPRQPGTQRHLTEQSRQLAQTRAEADRQVRLAWLKLHEAPETGDSPQWLIYDSLVRERDWAAEDFGRLFKAAQFFHYALLANWRDYLQLSARAADPVHCN